MKQVLEDKAHKQAVDVEIVIKWVNKDLSEELFDAEVEEAQMPIPAEEGFGKDFLGNADKFYGDCSSDGRAHGCGPCCRRFEPGQSPNAKAFNRRYLDVLD